MEKIDMLFLIVFAYAGYSGFRKGLISQAVGVVALLLGLWACMHLTDLVASLIDISRYTTDGATARLILLAITFAGTVLLVYFAGKVANRIVKAAMLEWLNKLLGLVLGIAKMALIVSVVLTLLANAGIANRLLPAEVKRKSIFYRPVQGLSPWIYPHINTFSLSLLDRVTTDGEQSQEGER